MQAATQTIIHTMVFLSKQTKAKQKFFPLPMTMPPHGHDCYDSFTYFSPLIFLVYSLHAPTLCLLFLVYILISFYRLSSGKHEIT